MVFWDVRAPDEEWNVDVFFESTCLARLQTMLAHMKPIVRCVDYIGIVSETKLLNLVNQRTNELVNCLQRLKSRSVEGIVGFDLGFVRSRQ